MNDKLTCLNCDEPIPEGYRSGLFCSFYCREFAGAVRYCRRVTTDGRIHRDDVREAVSIRRAWVISGRAYAVRLTEKERQAVFALKGRTCLHCGRPATEIDHIDGAGGNEMVNLQPLCADCHRKKSLAGLRPVSVEDLLFDESLQDYAERLFEFERREKAMAPERVCDDEVNWERDWRAIEKERMLTLL